jgi:hypothetical protein
MNPAWEEDIVRTFEAARSKGPVHCDIRSFFKPSGGNIVFREENKWESLRCNLVRVLSITVKGASCIGQIAVAGYCVGADKEVCAQREDAGGGRRHNFLRHRYGRDQFTHTHAAVPIVVCLRLEQVATTRKSTSRPSFAGRCGCYTTLELQVPMRNVPVAGRASQALAGSESRCAAT